MERLKLTGSAVAAAVVSFAITLSLPGVLFADTQANSGQILIISDEINGNSVDVERPSDSGPAGNNKSGLGDDTNAGVGDGTDNSTNEGEDNPNQAPASKGPR